MTPTEAQLRNRLYLLKFTDMTNADKQKALLDAIDALAKMLGIDVKQEDY